MPSTLPGSLFAILAAGLHGSDGNPLTGGKIDFFETGTTTRKDTFADVQLETANPNPVVLDGTGAATVFLEPGGYDFVVSDSDDVELWSVAGLEDIGQTFLANLGTTLTEGSKAVTSGYTVLATDSLITVNSAGGPNPCIVNLPACDEYSGLLTIKNLGGTALAVTPNGAETIDGLAAAFTVAAAASPLFPSIVLSNDGVSSWFVRSSHGL